MGTMRLLFALVLFTLMGGVLVLPDKVYAYCMCGQVCPQPRCTCSPYCGVPDPFHDFQIRNITSNSLFEKVVSGTDNTIGFTLVALPQEFFTLQCENIKEMLDWASTLVMGNASSGRVFQERSPL